MNPSAALALTLGASSITVLGQGVLNFANGAPGVNAPVTDWDGSKLASFKPIGFGAYFVADLYWASGIVTDSALLSPLGQPADFRTNGYFFGGARAIPGAPGGTTITAQVRVFDSTIWEVPPPTFQHGESALFQVTVTSPPYAPASPTGLTPFSMSPPVSRYPPQISITATSSNILVFSWQPYAYAELLLQQNEDLSTTNWVTLTNAPTLTGSQTTVLYQIRAPRPSGTMFYRLVQ
jgi:hypothetical protein